jgi:hypothetical protein
MTKVEQQLEILWTVTAATEQQYQIKQTARRISLKVTTPQGSNIEFDSAATGRPSASARELAASVEPLVGAEFDLSLNSRGQVLAVEPANEAARNLLAADPKPASSATSPKPSIQQLLRQPLVLLADREVKADDTWIRSEEQAAESASPKREVKYRLLGNVKRGDVELYEIETRGQAANPADSAATGQTTGTGLTIKSQEQSGTVLFSAELGRPVEAEQKSKLVAQRTYRETTITVTVESRQKTTLAAEPK